MEIYPLKDSPEYGFYSNPDSPRHNCTDGVRSKALNVSQYEDILLNNYTGEVMENRRPTFDRNKRPKNILSPYKNKFGQQKLKISQSPRLRTQSAKQTSTSRPQQRRIKQRAKVKTWMEVPHAVRANAFRNGHNDISVAITALTMSELLTEATSKLTLNNAARRVFLSSGLEVFDIREIPRKGEIYVSCGEHFKNPKSYHSRGSMSMATFGLNGLVLLKEPRRILDKSTSPRTLTDCLPIAGPRRVLVYINGHGTSDFGLEVVCNMDVFQGKWVFPNIKTLDYLMDCVSNRMGGRVKRLFTWSGEEVNVVKRTPVPLLDSCLQVEISPFLGPLWAAREPKFSPLGVEEFANNVVMSLNKELKQLRSYQKDVEHALDGKKDVVGQKQLLSLSEEDLYDESGKTDESISEREIAVRKFKEIVNNISNELENERSDGIAYRLDYIKELPDDHRLVGPKCLKLLVNVNGYCDNPKVAYFNIESAEKGVIKDDPDSSKRMLEKLIDCCGSCVSGLPNKSPYKGHPKIIFDKDGNEIENIYNLKEEEEVWVSFGEDYIKPQVHVLQLAVDGASSYMYYGRMVAIREAFNRDIIPEGKPTKLKVSHGIPNSYDTPIIGEGTAEYTLNQVEDSLKFNEIDKNSYFLFHKENDNLLLYPEIMIDVKGTNMQTSFTKNNQIWLLNDSGIIYNKGFPQLCLGVSDIKISHTFFGLNTPLEGLAVIVKGNSLNSPGVEWRFDNSGNVYCSSEPTLVLTCIALAEGQTHCLSAEKGHKFAIAVMEKLPKGHPSACYQRWGLKQENVNNGRQWKFTQGPNNPEWNKLALSWPTSENSELNEHYQWPMEFFFICGVPPFTISKSEGNWPLRLKVLKNGDGNVTNACHIVVSSAEITGERVHCLDLSHDQLMLSQFLESCTSALNFPSAARHLFNPQGVELHSLSGISRDDLVYASVTNFWIDPSLGVSQTQQSNILARLTYDLMLISRYMCMLGVRDLKMTTDGVIKQGANLKLQTCCITEDEREEIARPPTPPPEPPRPPLTLAQKLSLLDNAHSRSHLVIDDMFESVKKTQKKSYEKLNHTENNGHCPWPTCPLCGPIRDLQPETEKIYTKFERQMKRMHAGVRGQLAKQLFAFEDGFLSCEADNNLVVSYDSSNADGSVLFLNNKQENDPSQRWEINLDGFVNPKYNKKFVLGVLTPQLDNTRNADPHGSLYNGQWISLQHRCHSSYGSANQKWQFDSGTGMLGCFATDRTDIEITAANKAGICTYSITGGYEIDQPGYTCIVEPINGNGRAVKLIVCYACARTLRGTHHVKKLEKRFAFTCDMGVVAKQQGLQLGRCFKLLDAGRLHLGSHEVVKTHSFWKKRLAQLYLKTSPSTHCPSDLDLPLTVRVSAHRNGDGYLTEGHVVMGTTLQDILGQCTSKLSLPHVARKIFTADGQLMLDANDLISWAIEHCKSFLRSYNFGMQTASSQEELPDSFTSSKESGPKEIKEYITPSYDLNILQQQTISVGNKEDNDSGSESGDMDHYMKPRPSTTIWNDDRPQSRQGVPRSDPVRESSASSVMREEDVAFVLRAPIPVWVSCGEPFIPPPRVAQNYEMQRCAAENRIHLTNKLQTQKHVLRQMKGRRLMAAEPARFEGKESYKQPVCVVGGWTEELPGESKLKGSIKTISGHMTTKISLKKEVLPHTKKEKLLAISASLYKNSSMKQLSVYKNGDSIDKAVRICVDSMDRLFDVARQRLGLSRTVTSAFNSNGDPVPLFESLSSNGDLLAVGCCGEGEKYMRPGELDRRMMMKAQWSRVRRKQGVSGLLIPGVEERLPPALVNPYGPPALALEPSSDINLLPVQN